VSQAACYTDSNRFRKALRPRQQRPGREEGVSDASRRRSE
jgi:hypothetical protein